MEKVCIYYGYPILISGNANIEEAVEIYQEYNLIVFGDGYNEKKHETHSDTLLIIKKIKEKKEEVKVFGYISCGLKEGGKINIEGIKRKVKLWKEMGVDGVFLDEFGYDYYNTRDRQNKIIAISREMGMKIFVNSWDINWIFSGENIKLPWLPKFETNSRKIKTSLCDEDYFLYENLTWKVENGIQKNSSFERINRIYEYFSKKREEYNGKTYFEKIGAKAISLDSIHSSKKNEEFREMKEKSESFGEKNKLSGIAFGDEVWGASGYFRK